MKLRLQVTQHLGGCCVQCGYDVPGPALQIDHINGDGAAERRKKPAARQVLRDALNDTAGRYQLLCANCNQIKRIENSEHKGSRIYARVLVNDGCTKYCAKCKTTKSTDEFYRNRARRDGLSVYCGPCAVERTSADERRQRNAAIDHLGGCCAECGYDADHRAIQIDHVNGGGAADRKNGLLTSRLFRAVMADTVGDFQALCANCNVLKKVSAKEFGSRDRYVRTPSERRPTRQYLSPDQIAELARLVAVDGLPQAEVGERYGILQSVVAVHVKNHYPDYNGRQMRRRREGHAA